MDIKRRFPFLESAENRETFFRRIALIFPRSDSRYILIEQAYNTAKEAFREEGREGGQRYFEHLRAVALILIDYFRITDHELIIAAILHDIVEDRPDWTVERVQLMFGQRVACLVDYMSKPPKSEYLDKTARDAAYHGRFEQAPREFFLIKLPDRLHNLITLAACPLEKRARKIEETRSHYLRYATRHMILLHELEEALSDIENA